MSRFIVFAEPKPQPRVRACARGGFVRMYTPDTADDWKQAVIAGAMAGEEMRKHLGPVSVSITFYLRRPKSHYGTGKRSKVERPSAPAYPAGKPDVDNLVKSTLDALTEAGLWNDDAQVVAMNCCKLYADGGLEPSAYISVLDLVAQESMTPRSDHESLLVPLHNKN